MPATVTLAGLSRRRIGRCLVKEPPKRFQKRFGRALEGEHNTGGKAIVYVERDASLGAGISCDQLPAGPGLCRRRVAGEKLGRAGTRPFAECHSRVVLGQTKR